MNNNARFHRAAIAVALAAAAALAACASSPDLAIISPAPGSTLGPSQDIDPATAGLQIAVDATTSAADGSDAVASAGAAPVHASARAGHVHFPSVTFADGATTLVVAIVDSVHDKTTVTTANYSVDTFVSGCRITTPANHTVITSDPGDTGLDSLVVQATCRGLPAGAQVGLLENDDVSLTQLQTPAVDGTVNFTADLIPGANLLSVVAPGIPYDAVEVTLSSSRCRAEIEPPSGSRFNLDGANGAIADLDPATAGVQASVAVKTNCADGTVASLSIQSGGTVQVTANGTVHGGSALFAVTLPDGVLDVQGFVGAPGSEGASRHAAWTSDSVAPTIRILSPVAGGLLGPQDNVGTGLQFIARARGQIGGIDSGGFAALELDQGTPGAMEIPVTPDLNTGIFTSDIALSAGSHALFAKVVRASGNIDTTAPIEFSVVLTGSALAIVSPGDGTQVGLSQLVAEGGGAQVTFALQSAGLTGASATVTCGTGLSASATIASDGTASIPLTLPIASCAGALFRCSASANAGATSSPAITFTADDTAPVVTITAPANNATAGSSTEFAATTSCAGEGQFFTLTDNGTAIASGSVQNNAIDLTSVQLVGGQNQLELTVTDAAGNAGTADVEVISSMNAFPNTAFVTPTSNADYGPSAAQLDCSNAGAPVLKAATISITGDTVQASGLILKLTNSGGTQTVQTQPTTANGDWTWNNIALAPESNTLQVTATDGQGNVGQASVTFAARCTALNVTLSFLVSGNSFGYAQDQDHGTPGVQVGAQVQASTTGGINAANGSGVRLCSTAASATPGGCVTAGTGALAVTAGVATLESGTASFTVTLPDGPQQVYAEVTDVTTTASAPRSLTARATPPTVASISVAEDTEGQTLGSGPDDALNQTELDAASGTAHFHVVFAANSFVAGQTVQLLSTSSPTALGSAVVAQNGDGTTATSIPVQLSALNPGGYQEYVFYASVSDDAGNKDSTPGASQAGVAATTLGTASAPFVIAPLPTVSLTNPAPGTSELNSSNDVGCSATCPGTDPLDFAFAATTSAPDHSAGGEQSEITFLENGATIAPLANETNPTATSSGAVTGVDLPIANGSAVALAAQVLDPYGNVATSAADTVLVDSVPPELAITSAGGVNVVAGLVAFNQSPVMVVVSIDSSGAGTLESGQTVTIYADTVAAGAAVYMGSSTGAGSVTISIALSQGTHTLIAKTSDLAGNANASASVIADQQYSGPAIALTQPTPVQGGTLYLGSSTESGSAPAICAPQLTFNTTNVPSGNTVLVWTVAAGASSCGTPPGGALSTTVTSGGSATISAAGLILTDGTTGQLCAQTNSGAITAQLSPTPQAFDCDLQTPTVAWVSPLAGQTFVGFGQTQIANATPSMSSDDSKLGLSFAELTVFAPTGGTLLLKVDENSTTDYQFVSCPISPSSNSQTIFAVNPTTCHTTLDNTHGLLLAIDPAQPLAHTLTATFTAPSGNTATPQLENPVNIDVIPPAAVAPTVVMQQALGIGTVTIPTIPGDDGTAGGSSTVSWEVRYSGNTINDTNWSSATLVTANLSQTFPIGVQTPFQVVLPAGNAAIYLCVRAKDRAQNLSDIGCTPSPVSTQPAPAASSTLAILVPTSDDGSTPPAPPATSSHFDIAMRVGDLDGDGYDDVILNYATADNSNGQILIYFGGEGGISNSSPLVLEGTIAGGFLGYLQAFDVGDFDGDGLLDIAAGETDLSSDAHVLIWTGASILKAKGGGTLDPPIVLSDASDPSGAAWVGGTVRAVGQITGGTGQGDDLAISNYTAEDNLTVSPFQLALLQRGGAWSKSVAMGGGTTNLFVTGQTPATAIITLPDTVAGSNESTDQANLEAAPFTYQGATVGSSFAGLALSLVYIDTVNQPAQNLEQMHLFAADQISATMSYSSAGVELPSPADPGNLYGYYMAGGRDAIGDSHQDLLVADTDNGVLYLYDGTALLGPSVVSEPTSATIVYEADAEFGSNNSYGAELLPDLDGDGKAEIAGAIDPSGREPIDLWFGQIGDLTQPTQPPLPFFGGSCMPNDFQFCFFPERGQHIKGAPVFSTEPFGQEVGSGHLSSKSGRDLVILSQDVDSNGPPAQGTLILLR